MTVADLMEILKRCPPEMEVKSAVPFDANALRHGKNRCDKITSQI